MKCDNHIDWVFATVFTKDGARVVSVSRDKAVKLIDLSTGRLLDDINRPREPIFSLARHPHEDLIAFGSEAGTVRLHRAEPRGGRLAEGDDKENSFVREFERIRGPVHALGFSADGEMLAAASAAGEWKIYKTADGKKIAASKEPGSAIFAAAFDPQSRWLATAGADGRVRFWDVKTGALARTFDSVPISTEQLAAVPQ
jgi:WD40 repeat protein